VLHVSGAGAVAGSYPAVAATRVHWGTGSRVVPASRAVHCLVAARQPTMGLWAVLAPGLHRRTWWMMPDGLSDRLANFRERRGLRHASP
jgi:hypothetical protein